MQLISQLELTDYAWGSGILAAARLLCGGGGGSFPDGGRPIHLAVHVIVDAVQVGHGAACRREAVSGRPGLVALTTPSDGRGAAAAGGAVGAHHGGAPAEEEAPLLLALVLHEVAELRLQLALPLTARCVPAHPPLV